MIRVVQSYLDTRGTIVPLKRVLTEILPNYNSGLQQKGSDTSALRDIRCIEVARRLQDMIPPLSRLLAMLAAAVVVTKLFDSALVLTLPRWKRMVPNLSNFDP